MLTRSSLLRLSPRIDLSGGGTSAFGLVLLLPLIKQLPFIVVVIRVSLLDKLKTVTAEA